MKLNKGITKLLLLTLMLAFLVAGLYVTSVVFSAPVLTEEETASSSATVTKQVAISRSANLTTGGIAFGNVDPNTNNNNATGDFNTTSQTQFWLSIDSTTNTAIDICTKDDVPLTKGGDTIPNSGYTWNSSTSNTETLPSIATMTAITTSYDTTNKIASSQTSGVFYLRFTLDVPSTQAAGAYSNTVSFKGADTATGC